MTPRGAIAVELAARNRNPPAFMITRMIGCVLVPLMLAACGSAVGVGGFNGALASTTVRTNNPEAVRQGVLGVFRGQGFSPISNQPNSITFSKPGDRTAQAAWGTLNNPNPVLVQPTVRWHQQQAGVVGLGVEVEMVQQSTVFGDNTRKPVLMGTGAYSRLLRDVKRRVEAIE
jgi:hypothetical protein